MLPDDPNFVNPRHENGNPKFEQHQFSEVERVVYVENVRETYQYGRSNQF